MKKIMLVALMFSLILPVWAIELLNDWKSWKPVKTPLTAIGALPGCDADVSSLPEIYIETVITYCDVKEGGPGKVASLVNPAAADVFKNRTGKFPDGANLALHLIDLKVIFLTAHEGGNPIYGVFTEEGKNITAATGPLSASTCVACHSGYSGFCFHGQCATEQK